MNTLADQFNARGAGAHGFFQVYESEAAITRAGFLCDPSVQTPVLAMPYYTGEQALQGVSEDGTLWLELVVSETDAYLTDLQQRVEQLLQGLPVQLLRLRRQRSSQAGGLTTPVQQSLSELTPEQVWHTRLQTETLSDEQQQQLTILHRQVLAKVEQTA